MAILLTPRLEARARWRKRKREHRAARNSKLKEPENDDTFEDNEDDDDLDLDPPQNHLETDDDPHNNRGYRANQMSREKESEMLVDGGLRICEFPIAIKRVVNRPHSLVFGIVEAERAARNGEIGGQGQVGVAVLENISYGQLQALSAVPRDSPALLGAPTEETESGGGSGPHVIMPPRINAGNGVPKRLGSADWFSPSSVHRLERQVVPHFFSGKSAEHTPEKYMEARNFIVAKYMENPEKHLSVADCQGLVAGIDIDDLTRIVRFLDHWGSSTIVHLLLRMRPIRMRHIYVRTQMVNSVPSAALKSVDSLIQFDKPKCRLKAADAYPELARRCEEDSDFDTTIREQLSEHQCHYCTWPIPTVCYQSQKEVNALILEFQLTLWFLSQNDEEAVTLSAAKVKVAAKDGLAAAAMKAKLFADHEEREIQRLSANISKSSGIDLLKRLELKLKQFAEVEALLMRECEQMERTRQRITSERALMTSPQFVSTGVSPPMGPPGIGALNTGNSRQQVSGLKIRLQFPGMEIANTSIPTCTNRGCMGMVQDFPLRLFNHPRQPRIEFHVWPYIKFPVISWALDA
ncbi:hypothetical protein DH2020_033898 [Rehmannia glutinosa]|uniref:SWIRM domain-containing protein n=1 Tax=Rehmannia glutinosa TaxID=99300 RepID=A0ABR0VAW0_REHGL